MRDELDDERTKIQESRTMSKWLVQTLSDSKLDAPLSSHTCSHSHDASYAIDCYALAILSLCDEEEPVTFNEAKN